MTAAFLILGSLICAGFVYLATRETGPSKTEDKAHTA
ncbi:hypothetical protein Alide_4555 (plasmid) [Alicycliphilus denitrificans BC]|nr:hypothetical protein Alide_4555 [Alicycliphilus denitrificans BC]